MLPLLGKTKKYNNNDNNEEKVDHCCTSNNNTATSTIATAAIIDNHSPSTNDLVAMVPIDNNNNNTLNNNNNSRNNSRNNSSNNNNNNNANSTWIQEGIRRVRNDQVVRKMHFLTGMAAIGGFLFGYDTGVISGAMLPIRDHFHLNHWEQEVVVSSTVLAAFVSSAISGTMMNKSYGRRTSLRMASLIFTIGSMQLFCSWSYYSLVFGRVIVGIGIGIASLTTPVYIAEVATPSLRGKLVTINAFMVTFGQFIAGMVDGILMELLPADYGWRFMLGLAAIPSSIMLIGFFWYLPESPRWLAISNQLDIALTVLKTLRDTDQEAIDELNEILRSVGKHPPENHGRQQDSHCIQTSRGDDDETIATINTEGTIDEGNLLASLSTNTNSITNRKRSPNPNGRKMEYGTSTNSTSVISSIGPQQGVTNSGESNPITTASSSSSNNVVERCTDDDTSTDDSTISTFLRIRQMLSDVPTRRALILGCGLMVIQQCSGVNTVMYYAASIYAMSQFDESTAVWLSGFTALAQVIGVAASIYMVDRVGRRVLVLTSLSLVTVSLIGLGFTFYFARVASEPVHRTIGACDKLPKALVWSGITSYCYDCANIDGCGYCGGICLPGDYDGPFEVNMCPVGTEWTYQQCSNPYGWLSVFFMVSYLLAFGIGMGGMPWTINSEIYNLRFRSLAVSCSTATNWISNLAVAATFLSISKASVLTAYGSFWMYSSVGFFGGIWLYYYLPETKGLALEEIERLFRGQSQSSTERGYDVVENVDRDEDGEVDW